jgi:hypothetical protein
MKSAAIYLHGLPGIDKPEPVQTIIYNEDKQLLTALVELQKGYCEGDKPKIDYHMVPHKDGFRQVIDCHSDADFHYVAQTGFRLKATANKPVIDLTTNQNPQP